MKSFFRITTILSLIIVVFTLSSCTKKLTFEDIKITGSSVTDIAEGNYTLRYNIQNLDKYEQKNDVEIRITVSDKDNNAVNVLNNRIIQVKADNTYLVTITVSANKGKDIKTHNYSIVAVKNPIEITFSSSTYKNFDNITRSVPYGGTLTDIPEVPIYAPVQTPGFATIVTNSWWSETNFTNLTQDITVYAKYETQTSLDRFSINFDTQGGSIIEPLIDYFGASIKVPSPPSKDGFSFFGWYKDAEYKEKYAFKAIGAENITIYARWLAPVENATDDTYFNFEQNTDGYYTISAKAISNMPETLVLPNIYNGIPVTKIEIAGFAKCQQITTLTIPNSIDEIGAFAFSGKIPTENAVIMGLQSVTFAEGTKLLNISDNCFSYNNNLQSITIPSSITTIDKQAFSHCTALHNVIFAPQSKLLHIRDEAFYGCSLLVNINLPASLEQFSSKAFYECLSLESVTINSTYPPLPNEEDGFVFGYDDENGISHRLDITIYVLENILDMYKTIPTYNAYKLEILAV